MAIKGQQKCHLRVRPFCKISERPLGGFFFFFHRTYLHFSDLLRCFVLFCFSHPKIWIEHTDSHTAAFWAARTPKPIPPRFITGSEKRGQRTKWPPFLFFHFLWSANEAASTWLTQDGYLSRHAPCQRTLRERRKRIDALAFAPAMFFLFIFLFFLFLFFLSFLFAVLLIIELVWGNPAQRTVPRSPLPTRLFRERQIWEGVC